MKIIITVLIGLAFAGTASAAVNFGKGVVQTAELWGGVRGEKDTFIYRLPDKENGVVCYVAYHMPNAVPDMECVKVK